MRPSYRMRKYLIDVERNRPRRPSTPETIFGGLQLAPNFTANHIFDPKWQTQFTFALNGGPFADASFTAEELKAWLSVKILCDGDERPVELMGAAVGYGSFVLSARYTKYGREAFTRRPYGSLVLVFVINGQPQEIRAGFLHKRARR